MGNRFWQRGGTSVPNLEFRTLSPVTVRHISDAPSDY